MCHLCLTREVPQLKRPWSGTNGTSARPLKRTSLWSQRSRGQRGAHWSGSGHCSDSRPCWALPYVRFGCAMMLQLRLITTARTRAQRNDARPDGTGIGHRAARLCDSCRLDPQGPRHSFHGFGHSPLRPLLAPTGLDLRQVLSNHGQRTEAEPHIELALPTDGPGE